MRSPWRDVRDLREHATRDVIQSGRFLVMSMQELGTAIERRMEFLMACHLAAWK